VNGACWFVWQVNGEAIEAAQCSFAASYGQVTAADCTVIMEGDGAAWECGWPTALRVQPKELKHGPPRNMHES
jgi:hypothetical protein